MRAGISPTHACEQILDRVAHKHPEVKTDNSVLLAFIAMNKAGEVGAGTLHDHKRGFRYALAPGTKTAPALHDVDAMFR